MPVKKPHIVCTPRRTSTFHSGKKTPASICETIRWRRECSAKSARVTAVERFVFISTDQAINPSSVMGATKRAAEILLLISPSLRDEGHDRSIRQRIGCPAVFSRYSSNRSPPRPGDHYSSRRTRYFIRTSEAISLVLQSRDARKRRTGFMLDMGEPIKIVDLARDVIRLSNHAEDESRSCSRFACR